MKFLLDTHVLLWAAGEPDRLSIETRALLGDPGNVLLFSAANMWEIAIKLLDNGYEELFIKSEHAVAIDALPQIHRDPFDRMLIAQATIEGIELLTSDKVVAGYPGPIRMV